ncbi:acyltransferase [Streptomyces lunaelactis]|nr:acyltransferase [Streptomyces lunaelactis]NUK20815.1 acyltransferase [Streptomyces lunaelactis]NUL14927.1 acyltransferase [Streptomyces lunaelactis]NUL27704.1 acyltransferase [Streptomyces lunaelactis]
MIPRTAEAPLAPAVPQLPGRDRYFDLLRALALFRVVLYHLVGWAWLPLLFPSMGVMFALAGALMARSLKRPALQVIRGRVRRLLPPLWILGAVGGTAMVVDGWRPGLSALLWILPLSDPPFLGAEWAADLAEPLWYLRAYLWYVLLSPLLLRCLRRLPWPTLLAPLALSAVLSFGYLTLPGRIDSALTDFSTFGACWILGMARQEGILSRLPRYAVPSLAPAVMLAGLWWAARHHFSADSELDSIPTAQALWSFGAVLLLLHVSPSWDSLPPRLRHWDRVVTLLNSRAVTVYLWHSICIFAAASLWDRMWSIDVLGESVPWLLESWIPELLLAWSLIALCILLFGWAEDFAAGRGPRLWPDRT